MHEKRFHGGAERLRTPARIAMLETARAVGMCTDGSAIASVLDVGTGSGIFAEAFLEAGLKTTGIDPDIELLALARSYAAKAVFMEATAEKMPSRMRPSIWFYSVTSSMKLTPR